MSVGIAVIGCGMIADFHSRAIADAKGASLIGACDQDPSRAAKFAEQHDCRAFGSLDDLLSDSEVDAVTICTPSGAHLDPAVEAARAGKHIVVEKPLEVTTERCDAIIEACDQADVRLAVSLQSRFHESSQLMKSAVDRNRFGRITLGDAYVKWYRTQEYYDSGAWRGTWALDGGGALMNQAIHSVDLLLWLMGDVAEVSARSATLTHERIEVEDVVVANLLFASGALGVIEATTTAFPGMLKRIEISGSEGTAVLEEEDLRTWTFSNESSEDESIRQRMADLTKSGGGASDPAAIGHHGHTRVVEDFVEAIENHRDPKICGREGRRSVALINAIYESAKLQQPVKP